MKIKLLALLSLSVFLASCSQDDILDNGNMNVQNEKQITANGNSMSRLGLTTIKFIKESGPIHPQALNSDESLILKNNDDTYRLIMQADNNLVLYRERPGGYRAVLWHSNTHRVDITGSRLVAQTDGNLVIYNNNIPLWSSNTAVNYHVEGPHFKLQLYSRTGAAIPSGYRIKLILGGNNEERNEIVVEDFL